MYVCGGAHATIIGQQKSGGGRFAIFYFDFVSECNAHVLRKLFRRIWSVDPSLHEIFSGVSLLTTNPDLMKDLKAGGVDSED